MTNFDTRVSPAGYVYPADQRLTSDYWRDGAEKTLWSCVGSADMDGNLSWEYDEVAVYQHEDSKDILIAHDTGCSCPMPFEDTTVKDGTFVASLADFDSYVAKHETLISGWGYDGSDEYVEISPAKRHPHVVDQIVALRKKVEELLG